MGAVARQEGGKGDCCSAPSSDCVGTGESTLRILDQDAGCGKVACLHAWLWGGEGRASIQGEEAQMLGLTGLGGSGGRSSGTASSPPNFSRAEVAGGLGAVRGLGLALAPTAGRALHGYWL